MSTLPPTQNPWQHRHDYSATNQAAEQKTLYVLLLTAVVMVVEIIAGTVFGSMALLADGWHMGTHVAAFGITLFAYRYARLHAQDSRFSFGTGKVTVLGGFASAVALAVVALMMILESVQRLFEPQAIQFNEAIVVAVLGLLVNGVSVLLLQESPDPLHEVQHHHHVPHDHNLKSAYFHVLADALTSVLAIIALLMGKLLGWVWMDALMGIIGAVIIVRWAKGLLLESSGVLLDQNGDPHLAEKIRITIEASADNKVSDLHLWKISDQHTAVILSVVTADPKPPLHYKQLLHPLGGLSHISVEVNLDGPPRPVDPLSMSPIP